MGERTLLVVADDFGLTDGTSRAVVRAHEAGIVTATSVLVNTPASRASLAMLDDVLDLEVGLHGALVGEDPPCSPASAIPTLVDRRGRLAGSWRSLLPRLALGRIDPDDVRRELQAQLAVLVGAGLRVRHLDLHQHVHLWPSIREVALDVAGEAGITYVRTPRSNVGGLRARALGRLADGVTAGAVARGLATSDGFLGLDEAGSWTTTRLVDRLAAVGGSVVELNVHPGSAGDADLDRYRWGYGWSAELAGLTDPRVRRAVTAAGFRLDRPGAVAPAGRP